MKKNLLNLFVLTYIFILMTTSTAFADINASISQKQQQLDLYAQQIDYLKQQTEYLKQQTESLQQQNEALKQNQAYTQGYVEGQKYSHKEVYTPGIWMGGLCTGYILGHWPTYRPYYHHCYHHHW